MPNIKPISDLRNYTDELDCLKAAYTMLSKLHKAEERVEKEGWIDADDLEKELCDYNGEY